MITHENEGRTYLLINTIGLGTRCKEQIIWGLPFITFYNKDWVATSSLSLPFQCRIIGKASELTEKQCKSIIPQLVSFEDDNNYEDFVHS